HRARAHRVEPCLFLIHRDHCSIATEKSIILCQLVADFLTENDERVIIARNSNKWSLAVRFRGAVVADPRFCHLLIKCAHDFFQRWLCLHFHARDSALAQGRSDSMLLNEILNIGGCKSHRPTELDVGDKFSTYPHVKRSE